MRNKQLFYEMGSFIFTVSVSTDLFGSDIGLPLSVSARLSWVMRTGCLKYPPPPCWWKKIFNSDIVRVRGNSDIEFGVTQILSKLGVTQTLSELG